MTNANTNANTNQANNIADNIADWLHTNTTLYYYQINSVIFINGAAGTGKTYALSKIIDQFEQSVFSASSEPSLVTASLVSAPTGKALSVLREKIQAKGVNHTTLHAMRYSDKYLGDGHFLKTPRPAAWYNTFGLIAVDECSMLDEDDFKFLQNLSKSGKIVLIVGDAAQLGPVKGANIFKKILDGLEKHVLDGKITGRGPLGQYNPRLGVWGGVPPTPKNYRMSNNSLLTLATAIRTAPSVSAAQEIISHFNPINPLNPINPINPINPLNPNVFSDSSEPSLVTASLLITWDEMIQSDDLVICYTNRVREKINKEKAECGKVPWIMIEENVRHPSLPRPLYNGQILTLKEFADIPWSPEVAPRIDLSPELLKLLEQFNPMAGVWGRQAPTWIEEGDKAENRIKKDRDRYVKACLDKRMRSLMEIGEENWGDYEVRLFNAISVGVQGVFESDSPLLDDIKESVIRRFPMKGRCRGVGVSSPYCVTTHKMQGSEGERVIYVVEKGVGLDHLYTGVTRGRSSVRFARG